MSDDQKHEEGHLDTERKLRSRIKELEAQIKAMESGDWSELKLVRFENGQIDLSAGPIPRIAEYLAQMMQDGAGKYFNFMELSFHHKLSGPMVLSVQLKNGKTPNQLRQDAEAKLAKALEERDEALNQLDSARYSIEVLEKRLAELTGGKDE